MAVMLDRDEALKICDTVLAHAKAAGAEDAERVAAEQRARVHARFADNRISTSGRADDLEITRQRLGRPPARLDHRKRHRNWRR